MSQCDSIQVVELHLYKGQKPANCDMALNHGSIIPKINHLIEPQFLHQYVK